MHNTGTSGHLLSDQSTRELAPADWHQVTEDLAASLPTWESWLLWGWDCALQGGSSVLRQSAEGRGMGFMLPENRHLAVDMGTLMQWPGHKQNFVNRGIGMHFS